MTDTQRALKAFWSRFTLGGAPIKAYLAGRAPKESGYPIITYEAIEGAFFASNILTTFVWLKERSGHDADAERAEILDQIASAIPEQGARIYLPNAAGMLKLERNPSGFLSVYDDPEDKSILGGRISYQITYYTN